MRTQPVARVGRRGRAQFDSQAAARDSRGQPVIGVCGQDQQGVLRRLLERLQERIGAVRIQQLSAFDQTHFVTAAVALQCQRIDQRAYLLNFDLLCILFHANDERIRMTVRLQQQARCAGTAGALSRVIA